jgi:hypothetical protein
MPGSVLPLLFTVRVFRQNGQGFFSHALHSCPPSFFSNTSPSTFSLLAFFYYRPSNADITLIFGSIDGPLFFVYAGGNSFYKD